MTLKTTVLFGLPQQDISGILLKAIRDCQKMSMVTGFLTVEGAKVLLPALHSSPSKLKTLVVGATPVKVTFLLLSRKEAKGR
jgi:hypothetical protein